MPKSPTTTTDPLTGLVNREGFLAALKRELSTARKSGRPVSVAVIDIDLFGAINEASGSDAGDGLLQLVSHLLSDGSGDGATVYRYGGDAFSIVWANLEREQAFLHMERVREELSGPQTVKVGDRELELAMTISAGLAAYPDDGEKAGPLVDKANEAMYRAKVTGRNKVCLSREERMVTKTSHYTQGQLQGLQRLAKRESIGEAVLLREALNDLLRKYNA